MPRSEVEVAFDELTEAYLELYKDFEELVYKSCNLEIHGQEVYDEIIRKSMLITQSSMAIDRARAEHPELDTMFQKWSEKQLNITPKRFIH